ncbi:MAG: type II secretion system protein [Nitrospirae bacterium]|nr:type II secretion system protein [Magnetococcales bacterium]
MVTLPRKAHQAGFSLIEIAIVLVIIGLLLGGVMKGQTMVQNTKIKRIATDTQAVQSAIHAYTDTYWQLPGDDNGATARFGLNATASQGDGDGVIVGAFDSAVASVETQLAWNHLRCASLIKGLCDLTASPISDLPRNPVGGITGIAHGSTTAELGLTTKMVCMQTVPSLYAEAYDILQDDGIGNTGDVRGSGNGEAAGAGTTVVYGANTTIYICSGF